MHYVSAFPVQRKDRKGRPWVGVLKYKDPNGKWREVRKTFPGVKYKRDAQRLLAEWREEMELEAECPARSLTVKEAVVAHLSDQRCMGQISKATYWNNLRAAEWGLFPYLGDLSLGDLSPAKFQRYVIQLSKKYKPSTVGTVAAILWKTCKAAYWMEELNNDPTKGVKLPPLKERRINYLDAEGRKKLFAELSRESKFYLPATIAFYTGMRAGEICALKWKDIDLSIGCIHVKRSVKKYRNDSGEIVLEVSSTKTYKDRTIPIVSQLQEVLIDQWNVHGLDYDGYVVKDRDSLLLCTSFLKWSRRHGVIGAQGKCITMHGLRHTFATMCVQSKMDVKSLSSILGHASAAMTLDVYASADEEAKRANMALFEKMVNEEQM